MKNFQPSDDIHPVFETDYRLAALDLGNGEMGRLGLSFFDEEGGAHAVGTRRVLSNANADASDTEDCQEAFGSLRQIQRDKEVDLAFTMINPCAPSNANRVHGRPQKQLGKLD